MRKLIYPSANRQLIDIWLWSYDHFGEKQADKYIDGIHAVIDGIHNTKYSWRTLKRKEFQGIYCIKHQEHFIFFRKFDRDHIGVISVLHGKQDMLYRLQDDLEEIKH